MDIRDFLCSAAEYAYAQYKETIKVGDLKDGWVPFEEVNAGGQEYRAKMVDATLTDTTKEGVVQDRQATLIEVQKDDDRFWVNRPCDLVEILFG